MATYKVTDKKGIQVGTWKREQFSLKAGDTIDVSVVGQVSVGGKFLTLTADQFANLVKHNRMALQD